MYDPSKLRWNCAYSFEELTRMLLCSPNAPLTSSPCIFFWGKLTDNTCHDESSLCASATKFLASYTATRPNKTYYDLTSNPEYVCRTETVDGALMTLTTNTKIWRLGLNFICLESSWLVRLHSYNIFTHFHSSPAHPNKIRSRKKKRLMLAKEMLSTLGYPVHSRSATDLGAAAWLTF